MPFITSKSINFTRKSIPQDSLSMHLDVSNIRSYSGSGTTWKDVKGNRDFVSQGTTTTPLHTTTEGIKSFQFNDSGWWSSNDNTAGVDMGGDCTLMFWLFYEIINERDTFFEKAGNTYASYEQEIAVTLEGLQHPNLTLRDRFTYYSRPIANGGWYDFGQTATMTPNTWNLVGIKMSDGYTDNIARNGWFSLNGSAWATDYLQRGTLAIVPAGEIRIGSGYVGTMEGSRVTMLTTYNKMLSDKEVLDYYNVTKNKFGIHG